MEVNISGVKNADGMRARLLGSHKGTITQNNTQNINWTIVQLSFEGANKASYFDGIEYYAKDAVIGDTMKFQMVDTDGSGVAAGLYDQDYYDNNKDINDEIIIEEFGTSFYVIPDTDKDIKLYRAKLYPGLVCRIIYTSIGTTNNVEFICNLYRHLDQYS
jgi:hypothetical protein